jgi:hypothetical protein
VTTKERSRGRGTSRKPRMGKVSERERGKSERRGNFLYKKNLLIVRVKLN